MHKSVRRPIGQVMVLFAIAMVGSIGAMSLVWDVATLYHNYVMLQNAADTSVLAGAWDLPENPSLATATAGRLAQSNGVAPSEIVSTTVAPDDSSISMKLSRTVPLSLARVLGIRQATVTVQAIALVKSPPDTIGGPGRRGGWAGSVGGAPLLPIGLDYTTPYTDGQAITLNMNQAVGPGNYGPIALGGSGGSTVRTNIADGYYGQVSIGDWVATEPGVKTGPLDQGFNDRLQQANSLYPTDTYSSFDPTDPRAVILALVDWSTASGRSQVMVKGFAAVWIDSVGGGQIHAHFISMAVPGSSQDSSAPNNGARGQPYLGA